jgi:hypothetical protein
MKVRPWWLLRPARIHPGWWIALGALLVWLDHANGPHTAFPLLYAVPVVLAAWYSGKFVGVGLGIAVPLARILTLVWSQPHADLYSSILAALFRGSVVVVFALWFARLADFERELSRQVKVLEGLLAICSFCKSIRNERGDWEHLESFISRRSEAEFSHGVCPSCGALHYPDMFGEERSVSNG